MSDDRAPLPVRTLDRCLACGASALASFPMRYEFLGSFPAAECRTCGMRFLRVQPTEEGLARLYSADYFRTDFRCGRSDADYFREDAFRTENHDLLDAFERLAPRGALLEVGCAGGWLLKHARERGWRVAGVELSADAVAHARSLGLDVFQGALEAARLPDAAFDLVYLGDVLEHVPDCRATLAEIARVLRPGGHVYLRGPITTNSLGRSFGLAVQRSLGRTFVLREPPYHLWEFTPRPLGALFERVGFAVLAMRQSKIAPGRPHGRKNALEQALLWAFDVMNVPLTRAFNVRGDRVVVIARKRT